MPGPLDARERHELCDLLLELGPDAPTLCEGWSTSDLAAHLLVREREPLGAAGIVIPRLADRTRRRMEARKAAGFPAMVDRLRRGAPPLPWRLPVIRAVLNLNEWFVHHEDVRRADGRPARTDRPDLETALWRQLGATARGLTRKVEGAGLALRTPSGDQRVPKAGSPQAVLTGRPTELALYLAGRKDAADVTLDGPPEAVAAVRAAPFGL